MLLKIFLLNLFVFVVYSKLNESPIKSLSHLMETVNELLVKDRSDIKLEYNTNHESRSLVTTTPGYLQAKLYTNDTSCNTDTVQGLLAIFGIPIGICIVGPISSSAKIGYSVATTNIPGVGSMNVYTFTVYVYFGTTCSFAPIETVTIPVSDIPELPASCLNYYDYYVNATQYNTYGYDVNMSLITQFTSSLTPWNILPEGEFAFLYTSSSQCYAASSSTSYTTNTGSFYAWFVANKCFNGGIAQCVPYSAATKVSLYDSPYCEGSINGTYSFSESLCVSLSSIDTSGFADMLASFGITIPELNDDKLVSYIDAISGIYIQLYKYILYILLRLYIYIYIYYL